MRANACTAHVGRSPYVAGSGSVVSVCLARSAAGSSKSSDQVEGGVGDGVRRWRSDTTDVSKAERSEKKELGVVLMTARLEE